ncbi:Mor transcription activator family protein [Caulobacter soli]|uniref:Mor transcription activator family protein n=1 Tax=Caulobacter soli TaxID=2708539 RepID=UPI0013EAD53D|nr:Mor transcription activator family protein [Caulobacter soli]
MKRVHDIEGGEVTTTAGLIDLIGEAAVCKLSDQFGGIRIYVPASPGQHHPLTVAIGQAAADQLATAFAGQQLLVPMTPARRAEILDLDAKGWTRAKIARKVRLSERRIYQVLEDDRRRAPRAKGLFD